MMLVGPTLKTVPVTVHVPFRDVPEVLTTDAIIAKARATIRGLQRQFGIERPRLAVAGLNPHAGEGGAPGREDIVIIIPPINQLRADGCDVRGHYPAESLFPAPTRHSYDPAPHMSTHQATIPFN